MWVHEKLMKPVLLSVYILMVSLLFKWAMVTFPFDINIYYAPKLFFPSPMGCLGSGMQTAIFMVAAPYFWQHERWCCAADIADIAQQPCAYTVFLILAPWFELSQQGNVPWWLPKQFYSSSSAPYPHAQTSPLPINPCPRLLAGSLGPSLAAQSIMPLLERFPSCSVTDVFLATGAAGQILCLLGVYSPAAPFPVQPLALDEAFTALDRSSWN